MPQPKIPPEISEELREMGLTIWNAMHPLRFEPGNARGKADTSEVQVHLSGPGIDRGPWGYGRTVREAVDHALTRSPYSDRVPGLKGAMIRLGSAVDELSFSAMLKARNIARPDLYDIDDDVPF